MKLLIIGIACSALVCFGGADAHAWTTHKGSGCVTKAEYKKAKRGWAETKVHRAWGTTGDRLAHASSGGYVTEVRNYDVCGSQFSAVSASFSKEPGGVMKLDAKSAVWIG